MHLRSEYSHASENRMNVSFRFRINLKPVEQLMQVTLEINVVTHFGTKIELLIKT